MTIVASADTRNSQWANDTNSFGRKMLAKMGWKGDGSGLGKDQQGTSAHLRAVRRTESLGIGAESDDFGDRGWKETSAGFHGVLANLKKEYGGVGVRRKRRKEEKKRKKKDERRQRAVICAAIGSNNGSSVRLPQNKVRAGHARKMREAKDIRNKSAEDMAAVFGIKKDLYKQPQEWLVPGCENGLPCADSPSLDCTAVTKKKKKRSKLKSRDAEGSQCEDVGGIKTKKDKKRKKSERSELEERKKTKKSKCKK